MPEVYIALGANLGDREATIRAAIELLTAFALVKSVSPLYESKAQPPASGPDYLNGACLIETELPPRQLLEQLKDIERNLGRETPERWAPRPIDLDIALYDALVMDTDGLTIPHPRMLERDFVLKPLIDLNPELVHPLTGQRLTEALGAVDIAHLME